MNKKKRFINTIVSPALLFWLFQMAFGGFIQAVVAFFVKKKLDNIKEKDVKNA
jgi:hypothetical protein